MSYIYMLKISKRSGFYLCRYGLIYMCTLISVVKCTRQVRGSKIKMSLISQTSSVYGLWVISQLLMGNSVSEQ